MIGWPSPSNLLVKTNSPVIHSNPRELALIRLDEGVDPWHLHAISVANVANPAITSVTQITKPSESSSPTYNQSGH
jgi:hypothetical protein